MESRGKNAAHICSQHLKMTLEGLELRSMNLTQVLIKLPGVQKAFPFKGFEPLSSIDLNKSK